MRRARAVHTTGRLSTGADADRPLPLRGAAPCPIPAGARSPSARGVAARGSPPTRTRGSRCSTTRSTGPTAATASTASCTSRSAAVGVVAVDDDGRLLLVGQHRYPLDEYSWEIPEGGADEHESLVDGARRELREETGFDAADWRQLCRLTVSNSVTDERGAIFLASGLRAGTASPEPPRTWPSGGRRSTRCSTRSRRAPSTTSSRSRASAPTRRSAADDDRGPGPAGVHGRRGRRRQRAGGRPRRRRRRRPIGARPWRPSSATRRRSSSTMPPRGRSGSSRPGRSWRSPGIRPSGRAGSCGTSVSADRSCAVRPATSRRGRTATCPGSARGPRGSTRSPAPSWTSPAAVDALTGPPARRGLVLPVGVDRRGGGDDPGALLRAGPTASGRTRRPAPPP